MESLLKTETTDSKWKIVLDNKFQEIQNSCFHEHQKLQEESSAANIQLESKTHNLDVLLTHLKEELRILRQDVQLQIERASRTFENNLK